MCIACNKYEETNTGGMCAFCATQEHQLEIRLSQAVYDKVGMLISYFYGDWQYKN